MDRSSEKDNDEKESMEIKPRIQVNEKGSSEDTIIWMQLGIRI